MRSAGGLLRVTWPCRARYHSGGSAMSTPQIIGADVPSYRDFPYRAQDVLHLYRAFLRLIYAHHSPEERPDLLFRLRNEFASRRYLSNAKRITAALRRGEGILALHQQSLDARHVRQRRLASREAGAQSVDAAWEQLQLVAGHVLPGLRNKAASLPVSHGGYLCLANAQPTTARRR